MSGEDTPNLYREPVKDSSPYESTAKEGYVLSYKNNQPQVEEPNEKETEILEKNNKIINIVSSSIIITSEILLTIGMILALFLFYEVKWTTWESGRAQEKITQELQSKWSEETKTSQRVPAEGTKPNDAFAILNLNTINIHASIIYDINPEQLKKGPSFYPQSTPAGEPGNFALAAHRIGKGGYFQYINKIKTCDEATIETATQVFYYKRLADTNNNEMSKCISNKNTLDKLNKFYSNLPGQQIVEPSDVGVVKPVPFVDSKNQKEINLQPNDMVSLLTLTSCHPEWSNEERIIVHFVLDRIEKKEVKS